MKKYLEKLNELEIACHNNFEDDSDEHWVDEEYVRIRVDALKLLSSASKELEVNELTSFRLKIVQFFCANMGCHLDIKVLESEDANVLSHNEIELILGKFQLARWNT